MARCHARCRYCRTRRVLSRRPEQYVCLPRCRHCGERDYVADKWMNERNVKAMTCRAPCLPYPHRKGSKGCHYDENGKHRHGEAIELPGIELPF